MKIGIFTDTYYPDINGVASATMMQKEILEKHGHQVVIVTTGLNKQKKVTFEDGILRIPGLPLKFIYNYRLAFFFSKGAYDILKKMNFDIIHVEQEFGISLFGRICSKIFDTPLVYTYHTNYSDYSKMFTKGRKVPDNIYKNTVKFLTRKITENKNLIVTPSYKSKSILRSAGINKHIYVIPNAIDLEDYLKEITQEDKNKFYEYYNLPKNKKLLLYLGRIGVEKNIDEVIAIFKLYQKEKDDAVLLIVGDGPYKNELIKKYGDDKNIYFVNKIPHQKTPIFYKMADIFLNASTSETQGLTYIEAATSGAIILAKYDFNLDTVIQHNKTGFFFDTIENGKETLKRILSLSDDKKNIIRKNAQENCLSLYSEDNYYQEVMDVYNKALRDNL